MGHCHTLTCTVLMAMYYLVTYTYDLTHGAEESLELVRCHQHCTGYGLFNKAMTIYLTGLTV